MYYFSAFLLVAIGVAHSYLGERYILVRLFRRENIPKLFGGTEFTKSTLRFAWHLTTVAWFGFAVLLFHLANPPLDASFIAKTIGTIFLIHGVMAFAWSKGKHLVWVFFLLAGLLAIYASTGYQ